MDDLQFRRVLDFFNLSWKGYRRVRKGVKRRLARHLQDQGFSGTEPFLSSLEKNPERRIQAERLLTVSISRFFRDRKLWRVIENDLLPEIVAEMPPRMKVWSAGCARGEEAYSFEILWEEWRNKRGPLPELELWATDLNPEYLSQAQKGVYSSTSLREIPKGWRSKYFHAAGGTRFEILESIKGKILWKVHDLIADPPPAQDFHLIFLRNNLFTYYPEALQKAVLAEVIGSLSRGGFLIVGSHEKLPGGFSGVEPTPYHRNIYYLKERKTDHQVFY
jgi:chemotaxis protein methyltransferase CheR